MRPPCLFVLVSESAGQMTWACTREGCDRRPTIKGTRPPYAGCKAFAQVAPPPTLAAAASPNGPGSILLRLIVDGGHKAPGCRCNAVAARMNAAGIEWCANNAISLACQLASSALPVSLAKSLIEEAIRQAESHAAISP